MLSQQDVITKDDLPSCRFRLLHIVRVRDKSSVKQGIHISPCIIFPTEFHRGFSLKEKPRTTPALTSIVEENREKQQFVPFKF